MVHDDLGPAKAAAESASQVDGVEYQDAVELQALAAYLTHFNTRVGIYASQRMELRYLVRKLIGPYGISPRDVAYNLRWDGKAMRKQDHKIAIRMTTALVQNVGQTLQRDEFAHLPKSFALEGFTSGDGRDLRYHLAVRDHLPVIDKDHWCSDGSTLAALRSWLRREFNGDLAQQDMHDGTKRIIASWLDRPPIVDYGDDAAREESE